MIFSEIFGIILVESQRKTNYLEEFEMKEFEVEFGEEYAVFFRCGLDDESLIDSISFAVEKQ